MTWSLIGYVGNLVSLTKYSHISFKKKIVKMQIQKNFKSIGNASK